MAGRRYSLSHIREAVPIRSTGIGLLRRHDAWASRPGRVALEACRSDPRTWPAAAPGSPRRQQPSPGMPSGIGNELTATVGSAMMAVMGELSPAPVPSVCVSCRQPAVGFACSRCRAVCCLRCVSRLRGPYFTRYFLGKPLAAGFCCPQCGTQVPPQSRCFACGSALDEAVDQWACLACGLRLCPSCGRGQQNRPVRSRGTAPGVLDVAPRCCCGTRSPWRSSHAWSVANRPGGSSARMRMASAVLAVAPGCPAHEPGASRSSPPAGIPVPAAARRSRGPVRVLLVRGPVRPRG